MSRQQHFYHREIYGSYQYGRLEQALNKIFKYKIEILTFCEMRWAGS